MNRLASLLAFLTLLAVFLAPAGGLAGGSTLDRSPVQVDARLQEDLRLGGKAQFLVTLRQQADMPRAAQPSLLDPDPGRAVFEALRSTASRSQASVKARLDELGAPYRSYYIVNLLVVEGDQKVIAALASHPDVLRIESDRPFQVPLEPIDELAIGEPLAPVSTQAVEWNINWVKAPEVWSLGHTGQGITYANADTGVDWDHPALVRQYRGWDGSAANHAYNWWDAIHEDLNGDGQNSCGFSSTAPCDDHGHGTHTLGTGAGSDGASNQIGVAPDAQWIACRNMENGVGRPSTYIECLQFFLAPWDTNGANPDPARRPHVVSNSYSCPPSEGCAAHSLQAAVENLTAAGVFFVASAGNSGPACGSVIDPPGLEAQSFTVGGTGYLSDIIASFSSRGPVTVDGSNRRKPDIVAPGVQIRSSTPGGGYGISQGTSMAAPHVAGAVALLWSADPAAQRQVALTRSLLAEGARRLTTSQSCGGDTPDQWPNNVYGAGQLDILKSCRTCSSDATSTPTATTNASATATTTALLTAVPTFPPQETAVPTPTATAKAPEPGPKVFIPLAWLRD